MSGYKPSALFVATMETEHYTFTACGATSTSAKQYMLETWRAHLKEVNFPDSPVQTIEQLEDWYGIKMQRVFPGLGMRDNEQIWTKD